MLQKTTAVLMFVTLLFVGIAAVSTPVAAEPDNICQGQCPGPIGDVVRALEEFCWQAVGAQNCIPRP